MIQGHVDLSWLTDQDLEDLVFTTKSIQYGTNPLWGELGINAPNYPDDMISAYQMYDDECPDWAYKIKKEFDSWVLHSSITITKLPPGHSSGPHKDALYRLQESIKNKNIDTAGLVPVRINILLQDKKIGHFLDFEGGGLGNYCRGDYVIIQPNIVHSTSNVGWEDRYTMQISGFATL